MDTTLESPPLAARVARAARARELLAPGDRVLVAVSGGADSTALACLLAAAADHDLPLALVLGHVDHGWRGADAAAADRAHLEALAARLALPLACAPPPPAGTPTTEDAARRWRYTQLARLAGQHDCAVVTTGHHLADQAETLLLRLLRGAGPVGRAGIPPQRPLHPGRVVVRPLLEVAPETLRAWLAARDIPWREDPTNADLTRDRARVRARLRALAARGRDPTARLAAVATRARARLARRLARIEARLGEALVVWPEAEAVAGPRADLADLAGEDLGLALRILGAHLAADRDGPWLTRRHVALASVLLADGGDLDLPHGLRLHVAGRTCWLARRTHDASVPLPRLLVRVHDAARWDLPRFVAEAGPEQAALDADVLGARPVLRRLAAGDRFAPLGAAGRPRDVKAWLARRGVPHLARRGQLVVEGRDGIAWLVGRRIDARHAVTPQTKRITQLSIERTP